MLTYVSISDFYFFYRVLMDANANKWPYVLYLNWRDSEFRYTPWKGGINKIISEIWNILRPYYSNILYFDEEWEPARWPVNTKPGLYITERTPDDIVDKAKILGARILSKMKTATYQDVLAVLAQNPKEQYSNKVI